MQAKPIIRPAIQADLETVCQIYNEGIDDRIATFETNHRAPKDVAPWLDYPQPFIVIEKNDRVLGWAAGSSYSARECYAGIVSFSIYIAREARGQGLGQPLLAGFIAACEEAGFWKIVSRIFPENVASLAPCKKLGFRVVGTYEKHAKLDGEWRDAVVVERLLEGNLS